MRVVEYRADLCTDSGDSRRGVVMTMGALHDGHARLIRAARDLDDHVTVTQHHHGVGPPHTFGIREQGGDGIGHGRHRTGRPPATSRSRSRQYRPGRSRHGR